MRTPFTFPPRRLTGCHAVALAWVVLAGAPGQSREGAAGEWPSYASDRASTKYSPLSQINQGNFKRLQVAWTWRSPEAEVIRANPRLKTWVWECTPLMVGGTLYASTSLSQVAAVDAA